MQGVLQIVLQWFKSLLHKLVFVLRLAQHEWGMINVFNACSVRPERVEG